MSDLVLVILSDVHFLAASEVGLSGAGRECDLGAELVQRALADARRRSGFDALVLLGDLLEAGGAPGATADAAALEEVVREAAGEVPRIVVPGNHDGDADLLLTIFDDEPGLHEVKGYRLYSFLDTWEENDVCRRPPHATERFKEEANRGGGPLIVLQHNPLHPPIESDYPYTIADREAVMAAYEETQVVLSLSGHYHAGQPPSTAGTVRYYTCPALSKNPFRYALVRLRGREVSISEHALRLPCEPPLVDVHTHTQYAYCGDDVTAEGVIRRARLFGLGGVCLTEHADQLYLTREEHGEHYAVQDNDYWRAPRSERSERMPRYRRDMEPLRSEFVKLGLEVELDGLGRPGVRPQHLHGWDLLLGAVHWVPGEAEGITFEAAKRAFMANVSGLLASGIHVLAHPFRFFRRNGLPRPVDLYRPVARMLAERGVAAEINFHTNEPDPEFFATCIEEGVKIALGSDAHALREVADFQPHFALLQQAAGRREVAGLLYPRPPARAAASWHDTGAHD